MPKRLSVLLLVEILVLATGVLAMPALEEGIWKLLAPLLNVLGLVLCVAFYRRIQNSDQLLLTYSVAGGMLGTAYFIYEGSSRTLDLSPSTVLLAAETIVLLALVATLKSASTKSWFESPESTMS